MKPHHAVALALVGWYLMVPPMYAPNHEVDFNAPLAKWVIIDSFDTASECGVYANHWQSHFPYEGDPAKRTAVKSRLKAAICVSTDDPRLRGK
jgi:hypothetical protein